MPTPLGTPRPGLNSTEGSDHLPTAWLPVAPETGDSPHLRSFRRVSRKRRAGWHGIFATDDCLSLAQGNNHELPLRLIRDWLLLFQRNNFLFSGPGIRVTFSS